MPEAMEAASITRLEIMVLCAVLAPLATGLLAALLSGRKR